MQRSLRHYLLTGTLSLGLCGLPTLSAAEPATPPAAGVPAVATVHLDAKVRQDAEAALSRGAAWLLDNQEDNGAWGELPHPATAALCAMALHGLPGDDAAKRTAAVDSAMAFLLADVQPDGSIYPAGAGKNASANYPNYTTCIALLAMATVGKADYQPIMQKARAYIKAAQFADPEALDYGGLGYGHSGRADLSNAGWAAEAMYFTDYLDQEPYNKAPDAAKENGEMWKRFETFLTNCQNLPETNKHDFVSTDAKDLGGFAYVPGKSKAGLRDDAQDGVSNMISSGSMTYTGLKSMIYAHLDRQDIRVKGAIDYLSRNFTLDENPGMDMQAYYFYVYTMTRALDAYNQDTLTLADGTKLDWRKAIITKVLSLQKPDGSWWNDKDARYMESMPELTTPYMMLTLKIATGTSKLQASAAATP